MKKFNLGLTVLIVLALLIGSILVGYSYLMRPKDATATTSVDFVIPKGQSLSKTAAALTDKGLLRSPLSLRVLAYTQGAKIQAGRFKLSAAMTPAEIIAALNSGKLDYWVTFLEGWRREQFADALTKAAKDNNLTFDSAKFLALTKDKEGYLFPDSYLFPLDMTPELIVSTLENTMTKKIASVSGRTKHQLLTLASIVEREARTDESRRLVAGILWKRLDHSWPLQVDATLQYAKGYDSVTQDWWAEPTAADKQIKSPYNTYLNPGLPPGPICAPSESSLNAAAHPTPSDYWFYLTGSDGKMYYASDMAGHLQNIAKYLH